MKICINSNFYDNLQKFNYIQYHFWNKTTNTQTNTILFERENVASVDDILETANHFYYRGLKEYQHKTEKGYLIDTCQINQISVCRDVWKYRKTN